MGLRVSASSVKSWFQYRCDRKTRYECMTRDELSSIPVLQDTEPSPWAVVGLGYERHVVARLGSTTPVFVPAAGFDSHDEESSLAFLRGQRLEEFAFQLTLGPSRGLQEILAVSENVGFHRGKPDLVRRWRSPVSELPTFQLVDIKATQVATSFHKTQVALYALLLEGILRTHAIPGRIDANAAIWHIPPGADPIEGRWQEELFALDSYTELVRDFLARKMSSLATVRVTPAIDETFFHLYFKCEQCQYLPHCRKSIDGGVPGNWDVSAVAGLSHESKRSLLGRGVRTVSDLASQDDRRQPEENWRLKTRGHLLASRAQAISLQQVRRLEGQYAVQMPPSVDHVFVLSADVDAAQGNLVTIGYLHAHGTETSEHVEVLTTGDPQEEARALRVSLGRLLSDLSACDAWNAQGRKPETTAHIFVYEPGEAAALRDALGRHLDSRDLRTSLLNIVRLFPPEELLPEPEYRGRHHLPATALRSVFEQLYALPVKVAYDLARVSQALSEHAGLSHPYAPKPPFARPFSSLLAMDVLRQLRRTPELADSVGSDVAMRLRSTAALIRWVQDENRVAAVPFLRLQKAPFRFQATFDPLAPADLDFLQAQALLQNRAAMLETLARLAQPKQRRRDQLRCFADLQFVTERQDASGHTLTFLVPEESRNAELSSETFAAILTIDDPDVLLAPGSWSQWQVYVGRRTGRDREYLDVTCPRQVFAENIQPRLGGSSLWCVDEVLHDPNTPRLINFLQTLATQVAVE